MAFTNVYDATLPADTSLANALGDVIRKFKGDIAERLEAAGGGPIANRETPEALFGNANTGILFLATDEGITYQWDGTAWNTVGVSKVFSNTTAVTIVNPSVETDGLLISLPANILQIGSLVEMVAHISMESSVDLRDQGIRVGDNTVSFVGGGLITASLYLRAELIVTGTNTQQSVGHGVNGTSSLFSSTGNLILAEDITSVITIKTISDSGNLTSVHRTLIVKVIGPNG